MKNEQVIDELNSLLKFLNEQLDEIKALHEKFLVALTGVLRLANDDDSLLTKLHGEPENLKSYLIQMAMRMSDTTTQSYETIRKKIETIIGSTPTDRKS
ncbi:MAG: hypothetical protein C4K48_10835 [Candidatus Thorarchaeota archaeon]|nr:MAG: hypothetical protein C4K48_10835 [Candidatus Thorarchaeota archaeon]